MNKQEQPPLALFLSPHFDDIALSCGGTAARLSRMGARCICITVCAAPAPDDSPVSAFAGGLHTRWEAASGKPGATVNEVRRAEEREALRLLGLQPLWLDVPDAPYRRGVDGAHLYTSDEQLFGQVDAGERDRLVVDIARRISQVALEAGARGRVRVLAPLGVGHHVDHQLVFRAARRLGPRFGVLYYEDYPYVAAEGALEARLNELRLPMRSQSTPISDLIGVKIAAIAQYRSQLEVLFGAPEAMPQAVRAYSRSVAEAGAAEGYAERVWRIPSGYVAA